MKSLHDGVDTSTSTGRMVAGILMSIAEYERELVRERTALKLEHARRSGRKFGRPAKLNAEQAAFARRLKANGETAATTCKTLGIGRTTLHVRTLSLPFCGLGEEPTEQQRAPNHRSDRHPRL